MKPASVDRSSASSTPGKPAASRGDPLASAVVRCLTSVGSQMRWPIAAARAWRPRAVTQAAISVSSMYTPVLRKPERAPGPAAPGVARTGVSTCAGAGLCEGVGVEAVGPLGTAGVSLAGFSFLGARLPALAASAVPTWFAFSDSLAVTFPAVAACPFPVAAAANFSALSALPADFAAAIFFVRGVPPPPYDGSAAKRTSPAWSTRMPLPQGRPFIRTAAASTARGMSAAL